MIRDVQELSASLRYVSSWADKLEALRQHSIEMDAALLSTTSAAPLAEIRRVLLEAREFVDDLAEEPTPEATADYRLPPHGRQKVA